MNTFMQWSIFNAMPHNNVAGKKIKFNSTCHAFAVFTCMCMKKKKTVLNPMNCINCQLWILQFWFVIRIFFSTSSFWFIIIIEIKLDLCGKNQAKLWSEMFTMAIVRNDVVYHACCTWKFICFINFSCIWFVTSVVCQTIQRMNKSIWTANIINF